MIAPKKSGGGQGEQAGDGGSSASRQKIIEVEAARMLLW